MHIGLVILTSIVLEELKGIAGRWMTGQTETHIDRETHRQTDTDRQSDGQTDGQTTNGNTQSPFFLRGKNDQTLSKNRWYLIK